MGKQDGGRLNWLFRGFFLQGRQMDEIAGEFGAMEGFRTEQPRRKKAKWNSLGVRGTAADSHPTCIYPRQLLGIHPTVFVLHFLSWNLTLSFFSTRVLCSLDSLRFHITPEDFDCYQLLAPDPPPGGFHTTITISFLSMSFSVG